METQRVFCSYAHADSPFVLGLVADLRAVGIPVWMDQTDIAPGDRWDLSIQRGLETSATVMLVLSPDSVASPTVMDEASFALQEHKRIVPVLHRTCDIPFRLRRIQYVDFTQNHDGALRQLLGRLAAGAVAGGGGESPAAGGTGREPAARGAGPGPGGPVARAASRNDGHGGFDIGSVGGNLTITAGGDVVAGDKMTETTTSTVEAGGGFGDESEKERFLRQIEEIRSALRAVQGEIQTAPGLTDDVRDEIAAAVLHQIGALRKTREEAAALAVARPTPKEKRNAIERTLQDTCAVLDRVRGVCDRTVAIADRISPLVGKALPMISSARQSFGSS